MIDKNPPWLTNKIKKTPVAKDVMFKKFKSLFLLFKRFPEQKNLLLPPLSYNSDFVTDFKKKKVNFSRHFVKNSVV